jgi:membrane associated rhomboid family serine protease
MAEIDCRVHLEMPSPRKMLTPVVTVSILLMIAGYALMSHAEKFSQSWLAINPQTFWRFRIWQLLTYSFLNAHWWSLLVNGLIILFIGSALEREWRSRSFLFMVLVVIVSCGLLWLIVCRIVGRAYVGIGTEPYVYGVIATFGLLFRRQRFLVFFWPLEGKHLAWLLIAIGVVMGIRWPMLWIWVSGAAVAYGYVKLQWYRKSAATRSRSRPMQRKPGSFVDID